MQTDTAMRKIFLFRQKAIDVTVEHQRAPSMEQALDRLRMAGVLIDIVGKELAAHLSPASTKALLDLSIELETFEIQLADQFADAAEDEY